MVREMRYCEMTPESAAKRSHESETDPWAPVTASFVTCGGLRLRLTLPVQPTYRDSVTQAQFVFARWAG